jgi:nucleoside-diphosphate-sugar epimerase
LSVAWARLFLVYGPHEHPLRLVPSVTRALLAGQPAPCTLGEQRRDVLHVADAADALAALLESDVTGAVNVASGEAVPVCGVVERIAAVVGRPDLLRPGALLDRAGDPPLLVADVCRLRQELRWAPHYDLDRGLAQTVAWWKEQVRAAAA